LSITTTPSSPPLFKERGTGGEVINSLLMILVTGGTGLLGSHLLFDLIRSGKQVRVLKRNASDTKMVQKIFSYYSDVPESLVSKIEWIDGDLLDFASIEDALDGISEIYHAGAVVSFYPADHKKMLKVNIEGTANLVNLALEKKIDKFCYVSSVSTLGRADNNGLTDEETFWAPSGKNSVYAISKYGAEREVWRGMEEGLNAVVVNPSVILGPGFWNDNSGLFRLVWEGLKYYTKGINGYVDVKDVVRAMILLMEKNLFNERFIVSSENISYQQLFTLIAENLDKPVPTINVPPLLSHIAWRVEAIRSKLTGSKPEVTKEMATTTTQQYTFSNEKIRKALSFEFLLVEESIRQTCQLFKKDHLIGE
jgi:dihydroflavonol-4-reductase